MPFHEEKSKISPFFMRKLFIFALSLLSFVDNQHLGVKKYFRMIEGPKDKVILRITLIISQKMF
jgi:hypothetical protein